jgi:hypothetical protein
VNSIVLDLKEFGKVGAEIVEVPGELAFIKGFIGKKNKYFAFHIDSRKHFLGNIDVYEKSIIWELRTKWPI